MVEPGKALSEPSLPVKSEPAAGVVLRPSTFLEGWRKPIFILCLVFWIGNLVLTALGIQDFSGTGWCEGLFLVFATVSSLVGLSRRLPFQNVAATAVVVALISGANVSLAAASGI